MNNTCSGFVTLPSQDSISEKKYTRLGSMTSPLQGLITEKKCNYWGFLIKSWKHYEIVKSRRYMTILNGYLCCITLPDCPPGLKPELEVTLDKIMNPSEVIIGCIDATKTDEVFVANKTEPMQCITKKKNCDICNNHYDKYGLYFDLFLAVLCHLISHETTTFHYWKSLYIRLFTTVLSRNIMQYLLCSNASGLFFWFHIWVNALGYKAMID